MAADNEMRDYYASRAPVYDRVYAKPERQADLRYLEGFVADYFAGTRVLEIACGTGYWTQFIAPVTSAMLATDGTPEPLDLARQRPDVGNVVFRVEDAYQLSAGLGSFNGAFAGLWLSHIPKADVPAFIASLHGYLEVGAKVLFIDNSRVQCEELPICDTDIDGNTYQLRTLDDGSQHRVLKNFPDENELNVLTDGLAANQFFREMDNFWVYGYEVK